MAHLAAKEGCPSDGPSPRPLLKMEVVNESFQRFGTDMDMGTCQDETNHISFKSLSFMASQLAETNIFTPPKTNMDTQNDAIFERRYILKPAIVGIYLKFRGGGWGWEPPQKKKQQESFPTSAASFSWLELSFCTWQSQQKADI